MAGSRSGKEIAKEFLSCAEHCKDDITRNSQQHTKAKKRVLQRSRSREFLKEGGSLDFLIALSRKGEFEMWNNIEH